MTQILKEDGLFRRFDINSPDIHILDKIETTTHAVRRAALHFSDYLEWGYRWHRGELVDRLAGSRKPFSLRRVSLAEAGAIVDGDILTRGTDTARVARAYGILALHLRDLNETLQQQERVKALLSPLNHADDDTPATLSGHWLRFLRPFLSEDYPVDWKTPNFFKRAIGL